MTVRGQAAVLSEGPPNLDFRSVAWAVTPGTALVVNGYKLTQSEILTIADHVSYEPGVLFSYPSQPTVTVNREQALAASSGSASHVALTSAGELDAVVHPTGLVNHAQTALNGVELTRAVWVAWRDLRAGDGPGSTAVVIDGTSGVRVASLPGVDVTALAALTDRSAPGCHPPFGVLTRSEVTHLRPPPPGAKGSATLTTLRSLAATKTGAGLAQCGVTSCDPGVPVWVLSATAPDQRLTQGFSHPGPVPSGASTQSTLAGSWLVLAVDARTGPQDTDVGSGVSGGSGPLPVELSDLTDLASPALTTDAPIATPSVPATAASSGAPVFISGVADLSSNTVTLTFDRPVEPGGPDGSIIPLYLVIWKGATCEAPNGNAHRYVGGAGTSTITMGDVSSLTPGTTAITIASGLVTAVDGGAPNRAQPCTDIPAKGAPPPPPPPTTFGPGAPVFRSGVGDLASGTVTLTFDRPVAPGGPNGVIPMYLVIYGNDPTCATPQGNGHRYQSGAGTSIITVGDVSSLTAGTTYITIAPGLVTAVEGGERNRPQRCTAIPVPR